MDNEIKVYEPPKAELQTKRLNYNLVIGNYECELVRGTDFGKVPKAKVPSLWKSGAEKVLAGYGLYYDTEITDSYKDYKTGFFYYEVMAKAYDQNGKVVRTGVGCANTGESGNGLASGFNQANSSLKKAKKRAVVDLALTMACLSNAFTQDIEDETNEEKAKQILSDNDRVTAKQITRLFAIATSNGIPKEKAKELLAEWGYTSSSEITQKDYDGICDKMKNVSTIKGE